MSFRWNAILYHIILIAFDLVRLVEQSPDKVEPSPDEIKSHHWSKMVCPLLTSLWDRKRTQWATWGLIRTKKDSFWVGRLKWSHRWSQMVSFWVAVRKLLPLGSRLVSFWMVWNRRVSNRLTWSQLVLFWVAYRKAPPQRAKIASFWVVWFTCG